MVISLSKRQEKYADQLLFKLVLPFVFDAVNPFSHNHSPYGELVPMAHDASILMAKRIMAILSLSGCEDIFHFIEIEKKDRRIVHRMTTRLH